MQSIRWENGRAIIPKIEFYINHTCNLTCNNCNRFNNYNFTGWQSWSDHADEIEKWSKYISIEKIVIMGGEPLLNPSLVQWVSGLNKIFDMPVQILSNGTHISKVKNLYNLISQPVTSDGKYNFLQISLHNKNYYNDLIADLKTLLKFKGATSEFLYPYKGPIDYQKPHKVWGVNGISVEILLQDEFGPASVKVNNNQLTLHNSDPTESHRSCGFVQNNCYHMVNAKLYKCGPVALLPDFDKQHRLDISDQDRELMNNYEPLSVNEFLERGTEFLSNIDNVIPQCKFCPVGSNYEPELIYPVIKGKV